MYFFEVDFFKFRCYQCLDNSYSKIGFRSIHVVGEATALSLRSPVPLFCGNTNNGLFYFSRRPAKGKYSCSKKLTRDTYAKKYLFHGRCLHRTLHVVKPEIKTLSLRSTPNNGSFIFREDQQRVNIVAVKN